MTAPEPSDDYPESWKPHERRDLDAQRAEFEERVSELTEEDLKRIRGDR